MSEKCPDCGQEVFGGAMAAHVAADCRWNLKRQLLNAKDDIARLEKEKLPTWDEFRRYYNDEWDTDDFMGWEELRLVCEKMGMVRR